MGLDGGGMIGRFFAEALAIWHGFGGETKGAFIGAASAVLVAAIGVFGISQQIKKQGHLNRENVADSERRRLKAKMYEEAEEVRAAVSDAAIELGNQLAFFAQELPIAALAYAERIPGPVPRSRIMQISAASSDFQNALLAMILLVERRLFIDPRIDLFKSAASSVAHDYRELFHPVFFSRAMHALPTDLPDGSGIFPYTPPAEEEAKELARIALTLAEFTHDAMAYSQDFLVEMQNLLLSDLFKTRVSHRAPPDPAKRVIRLEDFDDLNRHFSQDTAWGKWVISEEERWKRAADVATGGAAVGP